MNKKSGLTTPSLVQIGIIAGIIIIVLLLVVLKVIDRLTDVIVRLSKTGKAEDILTTAETLYRRENCGISRMIIGKAGMPRELTVDDSVFTERGITVLAVERGTEVFSSPEAGMALKAGDCLLCYSRLND